MKQLLLVASVLFFFHGCGNRQRAQYAAENKSPDSAKTYIHTDSGLTGEVKGNTAEPAPDAKPAPVDANGIYTFDLSCDSMTTGGMMEWAGMMCRSEQRKVNRLQGKIMALTKGKDRPTRLLQTEISAWRMASRSFDRIGRLACELQYWSGGSIGRIEMAGVPLMSQFIRRACLENDYKLLKDKCPGRYINTGTSLQSLFNRIDTLYEKLEISRMYPSDKDLRYMDKHYWSMSDQEYKSGIRGYKDNYRKLKSSAASFKRKITAWRSARNTFAETLPEKEKEAYVTHTENVIRTLSHEIKEDLRFWW